MDPLINKLFHNKSSLNGEDNCHKTHQRYESTAVFSGKSRMEELWEPKRQTLLAQTETVSAAQNARNMAVLKRNKLPPLTNGLKEMPGSSDKKHGEKLTPRKEKGVSNDKTSWTPRGPQRSPALNDLEEDEWCLSTDWSYNRLDNHTPAELRNLPQIRTPVSPPVPPYGAQAFTRTNSRVRRLPVMRTKLLGETKLVPGGYWLQTVIGQAEAVKKALQNLHCDTTLLAPRPPAAPRAKAVSKQVTSALAPKLPLLKKAGSSMKPHHLAPLQKPSPLKEEEPSVTYPQPTPPHTPAPEKISGKKQRWSVRPAQAVGSAKKPVSCKPVAEDIELKEMKPLSCPKESLTLLFELLNSGDWEKKIKGLEIVQALAQHHADILKSKLIDVCCAVIKEKGMDTLADNTGSALLLKIAQSSANAFLRQQATKALDSLVQSCSPGQVLNVLRGTGLSHLCVAVRISAAEKLHLLAADLGAPAILKTGKGFTKSFLTAVSQMCVDASSEVRPHGIAILEELAFLPNFTPLWESVVPQKNRPLLDKILMKMRE